jgi:hypothetical protein
MIIWVVLTTQHNTNIRSSLAQIGFEVSFQPDVRLKRYFKTDSARVRNEYLCCVVLSFLIVFVVCVSVCLWQSFEFFANAMFARRRTQNIATSRQKHRKRNTCRLLSVVGMYPF